MMPRINPEIEAVNAKKLRKKVEAIIWMSIRKGNATPINESRRPIKIRRHGRIEFIAVPSGSRKTASFTQD